MFGVPYFAFQYFKSSSVTPRAREQAPQEKTFRPFATALSRNSASGGHPIGLTASTVDLRIRYVASPVRKICTSCPASESARACANTNAARVGSSVPQPPRIMIFSFCLAGAGACAFADPMPNSDKPASLDKSVLRSIEPALGLYYGSRILFVNRR